MLSLISVLIITAFCAGTAGASSTEENICRLLLEKYRYLYTDTVETLSTPESRELLETFNAEISEALRTGDFAVASILLEEAVGLLEPALPDSVPAAPADGYDSAAVTTSDTTATASAGLRVWDLEAACGSEFSRYDTGSDIDILPYARLSAGRNMTAAGFTTGLTADGVYRRDGTGVYSLDAVAARTAGPFSVSIEDAVSHTVETDSLLNNYTGNDFNGVLNYAVNHALNLEVSGFSSLRRYMAADSSNYDYDRYGMAGGATFAPSLSWFAGCDAGIDRRSAALDRDNDYTAYSGGVRVERYFRYADRISADYRIAFTGYDHPQDTAYLANDYLTQYLYAEAVTVLRDRFRAECAFDAEQYTYRLNTEYTPNQRVVAVTPGIGYDITPNLSTGLSVALATARHTAGSSDSSWMSYARGEDYDGITGELTVDWFRTDLFFLSAAYSYQYQRYRYPADAYFGGDTRTQSLVVFGSLTIRRNLELEVSTFHDDETQDDQEGDTRSTLLNYSAELVYRF